MKLQGQEFESVVIGSQEEMKFSIDTDTSVVFDILRDKMYSDKIGAVCREVASNSRDANIEAGKEDTPVKISIVNPFEFTVENLSSLEPLQLRVLISNTFGVESTSQKKSTLINLAMKEHAFRTSDVTRELLMLLSKSELKMKVLECSSEFSKSTFWKKSKESIIDTLLSSNIKW